MECALFFRTDGDVLWLECFSENPDAERGITVTLVQPGIKWEELLAEVTEHQANHK